MVRLRAYPVSRIHKRPSEELSSQVRLFADDRDVYLTVGGSDDQTVLQTYLDILSVWESR